MDNQKQTILKKRIFAEGETSWEEVCNRVATFLGNDLEEVKEFYDVMFNMLFLPNSPCLVNAGVEGSSGQLNACFVLPIEDDMGAIFETIKNTALIHKTGGGTGFNFSKLRAKGSKVGKHGGIASGPISFMRIFDAATNEVKQGGVRRGANMAVLNVDHPDIEEFITCKTNENAINNFNLSVGITDGFMSAWRRGNLNDKGRRIRDLIVEQAWLNGEPGVLFMDTINREHKRVTGIEEEIEATNPCGEQPLLHFENCCLGSMNISAIDESEYILDEIIEIGVRMLNRILDKTVYPLPQNKEMAMKNRKIGLGVMGYADCLIKNNLVYGSLEALAFTEELALEIQVLARIESKKYGNKAVTTVAPTGTISQLAGCSSGIEPLFALEQHIERMDEKFVVVPEIVKWFIDREKTFLDQIKNLPLFTTANNISVEAHIKTQAVWQKYTDSAVSKTINLPNSATREDVKKAILLAYELGCKGITVYRDGSRASQVISSTSKTKSSNIIPVETKVSLERPKMLHGYTPKFQTGCGNLYVTVNSDIEGNILEIFSNTAKGGCPSQSEALTRIVAKSLQYGVPKEEIIKQLKGIRCPSCTNKKLGVTSCPDAIAKSLMGDFPEEPLAAGKFKEEPTTDKTPCPSCGVLSHNTGGCFSCPNCGFGKCG